jgi:hypothetical protein
MVDALLNVDTRTAKYNQGFFEDFGIAVAVGQSALPAENVTRNVQLATFTRRVLDEIIQWLRCDPERNTLLIEAVLLEIASDDGSETVREIDSERLLSPALTDFRREAARLTSTIGQKAALIPSVETIQLAQRVADMEPDTRTVEEWADALSADVWHMDD